MCFDDDARPPIPVVENSGARGEDIQLQAGDGARVPAFLANPGGSASAQVVILPDVRGLHQFYRELAMRFAENGVRALAIDYFGRTVQTNQRDDSFEYMPHVQQMTQETFGSDVDSAVMYLRTTGEASLPVFSVGFCMGGSLSLWTGSRGLKLAGVIAFYASLSRTMGAVSPAIEYASRIDCPVLGLFGGADQGIPESDRQILDEELDRAGVPHEIVVYPGAPHSFFDRRQADHAQASANAWTRVQEFIASYSPMRV